VGVICKYIVYVFSKVACTNSCPYDGCLLTV
jgi:hypothetical protein